MADSRLFGYKLRDDQARILRYDRGRMAVSAVPGSGKTLTLSLLAARLISEGRIGQDGEVLVVTVQNSAVANVSQRIRQVLVDAGLLPVGFRVSTLHKLAADIMRLRSDLARVEEQFTVVDESETSRLMTRAVQVWKGNNFALWRSYLPEQDDPHESYSARVWTDETAKIGRAITKVCKHARLSPDAAAALCAGQTMSEFVRIGVDLYRLYDQYIRARNGLDFDDLIWRAFSALEQDPTFLTNLRARWPYILEDEAQDSSPLQEEILTSLSGPNGNWVRVGDPNQAINSTFTSADPRYLRRFLRRDDVASLRLPESGRCGQPIIDVANHLVDWTIHEHGTLAIREMTFEEQAIVPTRPGDPQQNPPAESCKTFIFSRAFADEEMEAVQIARLAVGYVHRNPDESVAVLCPTGRRGAAVVSELQQLPGSVPIDDMLRSTPQTRTVSRIMAAVLGYLGNPVNSHLISRLYKALAGMSRAHGPADGSATGQIETLLRSVSLAEFLFPRASGRISDLLPPGVSIDAAGQASLERFRDLVSRWVRASRLVPDQLLLTVAQDLFESESDLAICHSLATALRSMSQMHPTWRLADYAAELGAVAANRRSISGLSLADAGYREAPGRIAVTTMHKAKGLEWDAVYLISVDSLEFPNECEDHFRDTPRFMPDRAPALEARKELAARLGDEWALQDGVSAVNQARIEYIAERLRLLYVGITRARRNVALSWSAKRGSRPVQLAVAVQELRRFIVESRGA